MHLFLYVAVTWIAVDVLAVMAWHHTHVVARRAGRSTRSIAPVTGLDRFVVAQNTSRRTGSAPAAAGRWQTTEPLRLVDA